MTSPFLQSRTPESVLLPVRNGLFGMMMIVRKEATPPKRTHIALLRAIVNVFQLLAFPINPRSAFPWKDHPAVYPVAVLLSYVSAVRSTDERTSTTAFRILLGLASAWAGIFVALAAYVMYCFAKNIAQNPLVLRLFRFVATLSTTFLFIPTTSLMFRAFACPGGDTWMGTNWSCDGTLRIITAIVVGLLLLAFAGLSLFVAATYVDRSPSSSSWSARSDGRVDVFMLLIKLGLGFVYQSVFDVVPHVVIFPIVLLGIGVSWGTLIVVRMPMVYPFMNAVEVGGAAAFMWCSVALLCAVVAPQWDMTAFVLVGTPVAAALGAALYFVREKHVVAKPLEELKSVHEVNAWARSRLRAVAALEARERYSLGDSSDSDSSQDTRRNRHVVNSWDVASSSPQGDGKATSQLLTRKRSSTRLAVAELHPRGRRRELLMDAERAYRYAMSEFAEYPTAWVMASVFFRQAIPFSSLEVTCLAEAKKRSSSLDIQFYVFQRVQDLREKDRPGLNSVDRVMYDQHIQEVDQVRIEILQDLSHLWGILAEKTPDMKDVSAAGIEFSGKMNRAWSLYEELLRLNPDSTTVLRNYASFLLEMLNDTAKAQELLNKADRIDEVHRERNVLLHHINVGTSMEAPTSTDDACAVLTISGDMSNIGEIIAASPSAGRVFGYHYAQLIGQNVNILIPPPIARVHDHFLHRFRQKGTSRSIDRSRLLFGRAQEGHIFPLWLTVTEAPPDSETAAPRFTGMLQPVMTDESHILFAGKGASFRIFAASERSLRLLGMDPEILEGNLISMLHWFPSLAPSYETEQRELPRETLSALRRTSSVKLSPADLKEDEHETGSSSQRHRESVMDSSPKCELVDVSPLLDCKSTSLIPVDNAGNGTTMIVGSVQTLAIPGLDRFHVLRWHPTEAFSSEPERAFSRTSIGPAAEVAHTSSRRALVSGAHQSLGSHSSRSRWEQCPQPAVWSDDTAEARSLTLNHGAGALRPPRKPMSAAMRHPQPDPVALVSRTADTEQDPRLNSDELLGGDVMFNGRTEHVVSDDDFDEEVWPDAGTDPQLRGAVTVADRSSRARTEDSSTPLRNGTLQSAASASPVCQGQQQESHPVRSRRRLRSYSENDFKNADSPPSGAVGSFEALNVDTSIPPAVAVSRQAPAGEGRSRYFLSPESTQNAIPSVLPNMTPPSGVASSPGSDHQARSDRRSTPTGGRHTTALPSVPEAVNREQSCGSSDGQLDLSASLSGTPYGRVTGFGDRSDTKGGPPEPYALSDLPQRTQTVPERREVQSMERRGLANDRAPAAALQGGAARLQVLRARRNSLTGTTELMAPVDTSPNSIPRRVSTRVPTRGRAGSLFTGNPESQTSVSSENRLTSTLRRLAQSQTMTAQPEVRWAHRVLMIGVVAVALAAIGNVLWIDAVRSVLQGSGEGLTIHGERTLAFMLSLTWISTVSTRTPSLLDHPRGNSTEVFGEVVDTFTESQSFLDRKGASVGKRGFEYELNQEFIVVLSNRSNAASTHFSFPVDPEDTGFRTERMVLQGFSNYLRTILLRVKSVVSSFSGATVNALADALQQGDNRDVWLLRVNQRTYINATGMSRLRYQEDFFQQFNDFELELMIAAGVFFFLSVVLSALTFYFVARRLDKRARNAFRVVLLVPRRAARLLQQQIATSLQRHMAEKGSPATATPNSDEEEKKLVIDEESNDAKWQRLMSAAREGKSGGGNRQYEDTTHFVCKKTLQLTLPVMLVFVWLVFGITFQVSVNGKVQDAVVRVQVVRNESLALESMLRAAADLRQANTSAAREFLVQEIRESGNQLRESSTLVMSGGSVEVGKGMVHETPPMSESSQAFQLYAGNVCEFPSPYQEQAEDCDTIEGGVLRHGVRTGLLSAVSISQEVLNEWETEEASASREGRPVDLARLEPDLQRLHAIGVGHLRLLLTLVVDELVAQAGDTMGSAAHTSTAVSLVFAACFMLFSIFVYWDAITNVAKPLWAAHGLLLILPPELVAGVPKLREAVQEMTLRLQAPSQKRNVVSPAEPFSPHAS